MTALEWLRLTVEILSAVILPFVFFSWRQIRQTRRNEFRHLEERLLRIEEKLDEHIRFHLESHGH